MRRFVFFLAVVFFSTKILFSQKILFDCTKAESDANADWVIDADQHNMDWTPGPNFNTGNEANPQRFPNPSQDNVTSSTSESYWNGANSAWAIELVKLGYTVETLPPTGQITYGDPDNPQDLSFYDVFVVNEPNIRYTDQEKQALIDFVNNGGGLFIISDHDNSDRNNDGYDSPHIWNDFFDTYDNPFGIYFDYVTITDNPDNNVINDPNDPLLNGIAGEVSSMGFNGAATMTIDPSKNSTVKAVVFKSGADQNGYTQVMVAYAKYGSGKVVAMTDSSPTDDGTGDTNDTLYDNWYDGNNKQLILNATAWLAQKENDCNNCQEVIPINSN